MAIGFIAHVREGIIHTVESGAAGYLVGSITPLGPATGVLVGLVDGLARSILEPMFFNIVGPGHNPIEARLFRDAVFYGLMSISVGIYAWVFGVSIATDAAAFAAMSTLIGIEMTTHLFNIFVASARLLFC